MVHIVPGVRTGALDFATHAGAWQSVEGAQSASDWHASVLLTGSHGEHPQPPSGEADLNPIAEVDGAGSGSADTVGLGRTAGGVSPGAGGVAGGTLMVAAGCEPWPLGVDAQA